MYTIHSGLTREEVHNQLYLDHRLYEETANKRFSLLDDDYSLFALDEYKYPLHGNRILAQKIAKFINEDTAVWQAKKSIKVIDLGAAGGAITSLFVLHELHQLGLLDKVDLVLVDISESALESTKNGSAMWPLDYFKEQGWSLNDEMGILKAKLSEAEVRVEDVCALDIANNSADICICGFTHHHMNIWDKQASVKEMERVTMAGGIIGMVDESMTFDKYMQWVRNQEGRKNARGESVPIAVESFVDLHTYEGFLKRTIIKSDYQEDLFQLVVGIVTT